MGGDDDRTPRTTPKNGVLEQVLGFIKYMMKSNRTRLERIAGFLTLLVLLALVVGVAVAFVFIPKTMLGVATLAGVCGGAVAWKRRRGR